MSKLRAIVVATLPLFLFSSCTMVGPDYKRPDVDVASQWKTENKNVKSAPVQDADWWKSFNDPILTSLIETGYRDNLSVQSAAVKVLQYRAQLAESVGDLYPQSQSLSANYIQQTIGSGNTLSTLIPSRFETASATISPAWEIDFWGKYRRAIQSNDASFFSSMAAYDQALVTLTSDIATNYVAIRMYEEQIAVTEDNIYLQKDSLRIARARFEAGQVSLLDVEQALTQLYQTESSLPPIRINLQKEKDALAVLLGTTPDKVDKLLKTEVQSRNKHKIINKIPIAPSTVAVGIPKDLLRQRPDVHQAELDAIAQSEGIGAVKAQLYPALSLSGSFGFASNNIPPSEMSNIFSWNNRTVSIGPSLSLPLLNYGQITNQVRAQDAIFQQAILNYQNVVLTAQKEVQDGIVSYVESQKTLQALKLANDAAIRSTQLSIIRYKAGESDYTTVLDAEQQQLSVQMSLAGAQADIPEGLISLYKALGGGWQIRKGHTIVPETLKEGMSKRTNWGNLLKEPNNGIPTNKTEQIEETWLPNW
jgi:NodT family efflux transporter outer membrane factor (OMF) lipoprotein